MDKKIDMRIRSQEEIVKNLIKKYVNKSDNIFMSQRLFMAASVVRWVFENTKTPDQIIQYLMQVEKYLEGELELYWEDNIIRVGKVKKGDK
jgi:hypothetical protein